MVNSRPSYLSDSAMLDTSRPNMVALQDTCYQRCRIYKSTIFLFRSGFNNFPFGNDSGVNIYDHEI